MSRFLSAIGFRRVREVVAGNRHGRVGAILAIAGCTLLAGCGRSSPLTPDNGAFPDKPGLYRRTLSPPGLNYTLAIPNTYRTDQPSPLILALHFGGQVTPFYGGAFLDALVGPALQGLEAIIVAPDAARGTWSSPQSESDVIELLDGIQTHYKIDSRKTLITGYSLGGSGTWYMASRNQKRFRAAIPVSGRPGDEASRAVWGIPLYVIHSRQDEVIPFAATEATINQMKAQGAAIEFVALTGLGHYDTDLFIVPLRAAVPWVQQAWR